MDVELKDKFQALKDWICKNGGYIGPLSVKNGSHGNTIVATDKVSTDDVIMKIPARVWLTGEDYADKYDLTVEVATMLQLITELNKANSFYKPYLDLLPEYHSFNTHPILNFENYKDEWASIHPQFVIGVQKVIDIFKKDASEIQDIIDIDDETIKYVSLLYVTRSWDFLIPCADLFQHKQSNTKTGHTCDKTGMFLIMAGEDYEVDDEIFISYGCKDNLDLLRAYDFYIPDLDFICLSPPLPELDKSLTTDLNLALKLLDETDITPCCLTTHGINNKFLYFVRVVACFYLDPPVKHLNTLRSTNYNCLSGEHETMSMDIMKRYLESWKTYCLVLTKDECLLRKASGEYKDNRISQMLLEITISNWDIYNKCVDNLNVS